MLTADRAFSVEDRAAVEAAVREAETKTSGEIVPVIATASEEYPRAKDRAGMLGAVLAVMMLFVLWPGTDASWDAPGPGLPETLAALVVGFGILRAAAVQFPALRRPFIRSAEMRRAVEEGAEEAFERFRVLGTRAATGLVVYVSLYEGLVSVLGDRAIAELLRPEDWEDVRKAVTDGIGREEPGEGLREGIRRAGELLARNFPIEPDDENELGNELRILA